MLTTKILTPFCNDISVNLTANIHGHVLFQAYYYLLLYYYHDYASVAGFDPLTAEVVNKSNTRKFAFTIGDHDLHHRFHRLVRKDNFLPKRGNRPLTNSTSTTMVWTEPNVEGVVRHSHGSGILQELLLWKALPRAWWRFESDADASGTRDQLRLLLDALRMNQRSRPIDFVVGSV